jgi:hypothetical protein
MTRDTNEYRIAQIDAFRQGDMIGTHNPGARIAYPHVATVDANVTIFLNKASDAHTKVDQYTRLAMLTPRDQRNIGRRGGLQHDPSLARGRSTSRFSGFLSSFGHIKQTTTTIDQ